MTFRWAIAIAGELLRGAQLKIRDVFCLSSFLLSLSNAHFSQLFENCFPCHAVANPLCLKLRDKGLFLPFATLRKLFLQ